MNNLIPNMNQTSIGINGNLHLSQIGDSKSFESLQTVSNAKMNIFQMKIFNEITLILFIIYSFIKFKVLASIPKSSMVHLAVIMNYNRPTDHGIDHSSIALKRLTIQLVFNEILLFTFSKGTLGFAIIVQKNYLNVAIHTSDML